MAKHEEIGYELNIYKFWIKPPYPWNWLSNLRQWLRNRKMAKQRAKKGYCDADVWELGTYHAALLSATLKELADTTNGHPAVWKDGTEMTMEDWQQMLLNAAQYFDATVNPEKYQSNEYSEDYYKALDKAAVYTTKEDGSRTVEFRFSAAGDDLRTKFYARDQEIEQWRREQYKKGLKFLAEWADHLWD